MERVVASALGRRASVGKGQGMQQRKAWGVWVIAFAMIVGVILSVLVLTPREKRLLAGAKRIGSEDFWSASGDSSFTYFWLTERTVLVQNNESDPTTEAGVTTKFYRYDLDTHKADRLAPLSAQFLATSGEGYDMHISPDGAWILWSAGEGGVMLCRLDGTHKIHYRDKGLDGALLCWLGDSLHWTAIFTQKGGGSYDRALVYEVNSAKPVRSLNISPETPQEGGCFGNLDTGAGSDHILGDTACWTGVTRTDEIVELGLGATIAPTQRHTIQLPPNSEIESVLYSPRGDRVAWLLQTDYTMPLQAFLHRVYPRYKAPTRSVASVWVCRVDGTQMHEVGHIDLVGSDGTAPLAVASKAGPANMSISSPDDLDLHWMPDDRHLSFTLQGAVWSIATD
ncbi:MAG TPA: hypothetical protein VKU00_14345 [Chthonomonadaceae bacterium]|nr:hypothetical protein [Chthonomonadaceae bacterium]